MGRIIRLHRIIGSFSCIRTKTDDIQTEVEEWAEIVKAGLDSPRSSRSWVEFRYLFKPIPASFWSAAVVQTNLWGSPR